MATSGLYGSTSTGTVAPQSGSESVGLYGNNTVFGGSYFEWFIFLDSVSTPATPTGGSWSFVTNTGTPPTGWSNTPPQTPTGKVWISIALVNSKSTATLTWSTPGIFAGLAGTGTVTSVAALTLGTTGTDVSSTVVNSTTTPVITLNLPTASATNRGLLSSADWSTFNSKGSGTVTSVTGTAPVVSSGGATPAISMAAATASTNGYLTSTDWTTFNSKGSGSVTSVAATVPSFLSISGSPITSAGTLAISYSGTALPVANGGTGATTAGGALTNLGAIGSVASADGTVTVAQVGTAVDLSVATAASTTNVLCQVRNTTGAILTKGTAVYISGATGQIPTVSKALATSDATSAQTLGLMTADLDNNANGYVTVIGLITNMDTSAYTDGQQLYLSGTTAGALTATKQYAPIHLVYMAVVEHAHPTQGKLFVKVQNGYELDEIHNVSAQTPSNGQTIIWNATTSLWESANLTAGTGISVTNGAGSVTIANTGVTSVTGTSPVTSSGGTTPAIGLATSYGDTQNPYASKTANYVLASPNGVSGAPTFRAIVAADIPTLNQNTTGTASNVTGTVAIANGGTGATTQQAAINALAGSVQNSRFLAGNGTNVTMRAIAVSDVPTLNQDTTGNAANVTGTVAIVNGGTGQTTASAAFNALSPITTAGDLILGNGANSATRLPIGTTGYVLTSNGTTASWAASGGGSTITISNDTSTASNLYPAFFSATSGTATTAYTSNAKLLYQPSTGEFQSAILNSNNGIFVNAATVSTSYSIASGSNAGSFGPISVASGVTVTVPTGSTWSVV